MTIGQRSNGRTTDVQWPSNGCQMAVSILYPPWKFRSDETRTTFYDFFRSDGRPTAAEQKIPKNVPPKKFSTEKNPAKTNFRRKNFAEKSLPKNLSLKSQVMCDQHQLN